MISQFAYNFKAGKKNLTDNLLSFPIKLLKN